MNVGRGLFRAWVVVSALWVAGTVALGVSEAPREIAYPYWQYSAVMRDNGKANIFDRDWKAPYYTNFHSPSAEGLEPEFAILDYKYRSDWDKYVDDGTMKRTFFPDGSRIYMSTGLNGADQKYVAESSGPDAGGAGEPKPGSGS